MSDSLRQNDLVRVKADDRIGRITALSGSDSECIVRFELRTSAGTVIDDSGWIPQSAVQPY